MGEGSLSLKEAKNLKKENFLERERRRHRDRDREKENSKKPKWCKPEKKGLEIEANVDAQLEAIRKL